MHFTAQLFPHFLTKHTVIVTQDFTIYVLFKVSLLQMAIKFDVSITNETWSLNICTTKSYFWIKEYVHLSSQILVIRLQAVTNNRICIHWHPVILCQPAYAGDTLEV